MKIWWITFLALSETLILTAATAQSGQVENININITSPNGLESAGESVDYSGPLNQEQDYPVEIQKNPGISSNTVEESHVYQQLSPNLRPPLTSTLFQGFSNDPIFYNDLDAEKVSHLQPRAVGFVPPSGNRNNNDLDTASTFIIGPHSGRFFGAGVPSVWFPPFQPYRYNHYRRPHHSHHNHHHHHRPRYYNYG